MRDSSLALRMTSCLFYHCNLNAATLLSQVQRLDLTDPAARCWVAALPEHHNLFRQVSQNRFLMADAIDVHPDALPGGALRERAWRLVEPQYLATLAGLVEQFGVAKANGLGAEDLAPGAEAAVAGRVATLLVEAERHLPGRIDYASGQIASGDLAHPEINDLLDDLGELVVSKGGEVVIVPVERILDANGNRGDLPVLSRTPDPFVTEIPNSF